MASAYAIAAGVPADVPPFAADDPCRLLTNAQVRDVFPDAESGNRDRKREKYGIRTCGWETGTGQFALELYAAKDGNADNEIRGLSEGFLDPLKPDVEESIRYESVPGVGAQAMAVVEVRDDARGVLADAALLVARNGDQFLMLQSSDLARGDRAKALQSLADLARLAVVKM